MGTFLVLSILAYHTYLQLDRKWIDLILSGCAGGVAFLSKLPGMLVIPGVIVASALNFVTTVRNKVFRTSEAYRNELWVQLRALMIWLLVFLVAIFIVWPAMWVKPIQTISQMFSSPLLFTGMDTDVSHIVTSQADNYNVSGGLIDNINDTVKRFALYMGNYFVWRTSPIVLIGLFWLIPGYLLKWDLLGKENARSLVRLLLCLALYFAIFVSISDKYSEKYIVPVFLATDIAAGLGWVAAIGALGQKFAVPRRRFFTYSCLSLILIIQSLIIWNYHPYYFTYYNPLLGGSKRAGETRFVGVGEGLDQAAAFLNQLPDADKIRVLSWYGKGPFSFYFQGKTSTISTDNTWVGNLDERLKRADYLVTYTNEWYRRQPPELFDLLDKVEPIHRVWIDGIEYARIYKVSDMPAN
jgi:4-amino-4-deoxy-L-arabinose transferase-like glycosyltransferase